MTTVTEPRLRASEIPQMVDVDGHIDDSLLRVHGCYVRPIAAVIEPEHDDTTADQHGWDRLPAAFRYVAADEDLDEPGFPDGWSASTGCGCALCTEGTTGTAIMRLRQAAAGPGDRPGDGELAEWERELLAGERTAVRRGLAAPTSIRAWLYPSAENVTAPTRSELDRAVGLPVQGMVVGFDGSRSGDSELPTIAIRLGDLTYTLPRRGGRGVPLESFRTMIAEAARAEAVAIQLRALEGADGAVDEVQRWLSEASFAQRYGAGRRDPDPATPRERALRTHRNRNNGPEQVPFARRGRGGPR